MIFKIKEKIKPKIGDMKIVTKFAWLPVRVNATTIIWLEKYYIKYQLCNGNQLDYNGNLVKYTKWIELEF